MKLRFRLNTIKNKLIITFILLTAIPLILSSLATYIQTDSATYEATKSQVNDHLVSLREVKKIQLQTYINNLQKQILSYSIDPATVSAVQGLSIAFQSDKEIAAEGIEEKRVELIRFYKTTFATKYNKSNNKPFSDAESFVQQLDDISVFQQHAFIALNESPFGEKYNLRDPDNDSALGSKHNENYDTLFSFYQNLNVADILLVDEKGYVVYTTQKNIEFATNLITGPFKNTSLGRAYQKAMKLEDSSYSSMTDFSAHLADFNHPASFIISPIQDMEEDDAFEILGTMIIKINPDAINNIISSNKKWASIGLGTTGDIYLVGPDKTSFSANRLLLENKKVF